jgi:copper chaperone CopZ
MCKSTIEKAATSLKGVKAAEWDGQTDMVTVKYDPAKTDLNAIKKAIADKGYDNDAFRAPDDVYAKLPGCCHYDRSLAPTSAVDPGASEASFTVYGNCGMCKRRIEGALVSLPGVQSAMWDSEAQTAKVVFDETQVSLDELKKKVAEVGHDTDTFRADDAVYAKLPGCCLYERPKN